MSHPPKGGTTVLTLPSNHLSHDLTWFGLALALFGVFAAFLGKRVDAAMTTRDDAKAATLESVLVSVA